MSRCSNNEQHKRQLAETVVAFAPSTGFLIVASLLKRLVTPSTPPPLNTQLSLLRCLSTDNVALLSRLQQRPQIVKCVAGSRQQSAGTGPIKVKNIQCLPRNAREAGLWRGVMRGRGGGMVGVAVAWCILAVAVAVTVCRQPRFN